MAGPGVAAVISPQIGLGRPGQVGIGDIRHALEEIAGGARTLLDAKAAGEILKAATKGDEGDQPDREGADVLAKQVSAVKDLASISTEREKLLLDENKMLRERLDSLEQRIKESKFEERREEVSAATAMLDMVLKLSDRFDKLVDKLQQGMQQPQGGPYQQVMDKLLSRAVDQVIEPVNPEEYWDRMMERVQKLAPMMGFVPAGQQNPQMMDWMLKMAMGMKQIEMQGQVDQIKAQAEHQRARALTTAMGYLAPAVAPTLLQRLGGALGGPQGPGGGGQGVPGPQAAPPPPPPPPQPEAQPRPRAYSGSPGARAPVTQLAWYRCTNCGQEQIFRDGPRERYYCPGCGQEVFTGDAGPSEAAQEESAEPVTSPES